MTNTLLSIIVPTYNSISKMNETLSSLRAIPKSVSHEVIFVDDCSTDTTFAKLSQLSDTVDGWNIYRMDRNSGSAAEPRNYGIDRATGKYVFFLDSDDVLLPEGVGAICAFAAQHDHEVIRSAILLTEGNGHTKLVDKIPHWEKYQERESRIRAIVRHQSLTCSFLVQRDLLIHNHIRFPTGRRIGEDICYTAQVLAVATRIAYQDTAVRTYVRNSDGEESVTQSLSSHQFADFIRSWNDVEKILEPSGVSFVAEHGHAALQYAMRQFIWFKSEPLDEATFRLFHDYISKHWSIIQGFPFAERYAGLVGLAMSGTLEEFNKATKLRLVVAGHDLKFLNNLIPAFEREFDVRIDNWAGHNEHDIAASQQLLKWTDLVWAEWLLGAAVWYSKNVRSDQRLVIRAHRSEMTADYGLDLKLKHCSKIVAIAPHCLGDFSDRFDIPRSKFALIPNGFDVAAYKIGNDPNRLFTISMVGILPKLKGFDKAIQLLSLLKTADSRFRLRIFGKKPSELAWLNRIASEREYFSGCETLVDDLQLQDSIEYSGWVDTTTELSKVGFVVSLSKYEGMQVGPGEAFCAGAQGLFLNWRGVEFGYPREFIFTSVEEMASHILTNLDAEIHSNNADFGRKHIETNFDQLRVNSEVMQLLRSIRA